MKRLVVGLVAALALAGCSTGKDAVVQGSSFSFVSPGGKVDITYDVAQRQTAPVLAGEDLMNEGKQLSLADYGGKVVVLNLWGQWCGPCRTEAPEMESLAKQGVQVVGIDVRDPSREVAQDFVRDRELTYPSIYDPDGRVLLKLSGYPRNIIPSTIVLDKQHRVAAVFLRPVLAQDLLPVTQRLTAEA
ncbi:MULTISPECIES: redoxin domain-containing protein [unclassified Amycolatopsis]|uniref:redoxin domain-containing protein n=1 Tax=unclassified Amycolatopsis TaxID=2618356 RepID=UPI0028742C67|nr:MULTISPECIES: redoxin domain-containing protein [unclassified Amycolatopsis]MDS0132579.1 TlpA family protein disulfide reductase [Amycolatopsis sp. 505]MDS0142596.1 TlpA family protein disulfide reductase [Amycolatopsis sp. CM201R]